MTELRRSGGQTTQINVVLAESHDGMRRSLRLVLDNAPGIVVVAEASDLAGALEQVLSRRPEVLVLDLSMPGGSSIELIEHMRHQQPSTEIVIVTMLESPAFARRAMEIGARGFVLKDAADAELPAAVRRAAQRLTYTSPRVGQTSV